MKLLNFLSGIKSEESVEHKVNPVYDTAKSCLTNLSKAGCEEAEELGGKLNFKDNIKSESPVNIGVELFQEARYKFLNCCIRESGYKNVLDIGCGYSPRGILLAREGFHYVGADIPAVVSDMNKAIALCEITAETDSPKYISTDATDPEGLVAAAEGLSGPICIVTEGVLMYFPIYEMKAVINGLQAVLKKHGGCMYTPDFCMNRLMTVSAAATTGKLTGKFLQKIATNVVSQYTYGTKDEMDPSSWYAREDDEIPYNFFTENGFHVERIPVYDSSVKLNTLEKIKKKRREVLIHEYGNTFGWRITLT